MVGINKVILVGNLGSKPELKYTAKGVPVARFSVATTERLGLDESGKVREHTEWHRIVVWRKLAEICNQYLDKGSKVYVEGRIRTNKWTDQNNIDRYSTEIHVDQMVMLSPKGSAREMSDEEPPFMPDDMPSMNERTSFPNRGGRSEATEIDIDAPTSTGDDFL